MKLRNILPVLSYLIAELCNASYRMQIQYEIFNHERNDIFAIYYLLVKLQPKGHRVAEQGG
jgi:hypothetical protein